MHRKLFPVGFVVVSLIVGVLPANADLTGDSVNGSAVRPSDGETPFSGSATVSGSREFEGGFFNDIFTIFADFTGDTVTVGFEFFALGGVVGAAGAGWVFDFSSLDFPGSDITGVSLIDQGVTSPLGGWDEHPNDWGITTTADSISFDTIAGWEINNTGGVTGVHQVFATFQIETQPIPAPGAALLGMLGLGIVGWFRRR